MVTFSVQGGGMLIGVCLGGGGNYAGIRTRSLKESCSCRCRRWRGADRRQFNIVPSWWSQLLKYTHINKLTVKCQLHKIPSWHGSHVPPRLNLMFLSSAQMWLFYLKIMRTATTWIPYTIYEKEQSTYPGEIPLIMGDQNLGLIECYLIYWWVEVRW